MAQIIYKVDWLEEVLKKIWNIKTQKVLNTWIKKSIILAQRKAQIETPVDKGILRNSYRTEFKNLEWKLFNTKKYWIFVHEGTKPHEIRIKRKRALSDWKMIFWTKVLHPWTKPNPFLTRTRDSIEPQVIKILNSEILKALKV